MRRRKYASMTSGLYWAKYFHFYFIWDVDIFQHWLEYTPISFTPVYHFMAADFAFRPWYKLRDFLSTHIAAAGHFHIYITLN